MKTASLVFVIATCLSCGGDDDGGAVDAAQGTPDAAAGTADSAPGSADSAPVDATGDADATPSCFDSTLDVAPRVDLVFIIDNTASMGTEIQALETNINSAMAAVLDAADVDYRIILLTEHGPLSSQSVCIEAPLSGIATGGCATPPSQPVNNPPHFYHFSVAEVSGHEMICTFITKFSAADDFNVFPTGLQSVLRPSAFKIIIPVTDDGMQCTDGVGTYNDNNVPTDGQNAAVLVDNALFALSAAQFGTSGNRRYRVHSLVSLENFNALDPTVPWAPSDPITTNECVSAIDPGTGYQGMSKVTGGLRFALCETGSMASFLQQISADAVSAAEFPCTFPLPDPGNGVPAAGDVSLMYYPGGTGTPTELQQRADTSTCGDGYVIAGADITLCPTTCAAYEADGAARRIDAIYAQCP